MTRRQRMRWVTGGAVAVVMAVCAVGAAAAPAGGRAAAAPTALRGCYPRGSVTIAQDKVGRFYHSGNYGSRESWYVCGFKQGMRWRLPYRAVPDAGVPYGQNAKVSGRYVAFFVVCPCAGVVVVYDMVTGHRTFSEALGDAPAAHAASLVLKPDGPVAWTAHPLSGDWEVSRDDSSGTAVVDSGPGIDPSSLAAGGSWLYWTNAGSPRSAPFH